MTPGAIICPHCQSPKGRLLADQVGLVGWCSDCHKPWIPEQRSERDGGAVLRKARVTDLRAAG